MKKNTFKTFVAYFDFCIQTEILFSIFLAISIGFSLVFFFTDVQQICNGFSMDFPLISIDFQWISHGFSVDFPWIFK